MTQYGVTPDGFVVKPYEVILADIEADQRANISATLNLSEATPWGKNNRLKARQIANAWLIAEQCYNGFDRDKANADQLVSLGKLTGTERRGASYSFVVCDCDLDAGTTLEAGIHFAQVETDPESLWTPVEDFTAEGGDTYPVTFRAENTGPVTAIADSITVIHTSVPGWNAVNNPEDAQPGRDVDDPDTHKQRQYDQLAAAGSATARAVRSDVLEVDGVEDCIVFENDSDDWVDGMPPHSIEVLVFDGETPAADNDEIAQAIWNTRAAGVRPHGSTEGTATDALGNERVMQFTRPTYKPVYIAVELQKNDAYPGDDEARAFLVAQSQPLHGIGTSGKRRQVDSLLFDLPGVLDILAFTWGFAPSPTGTANLNAAKREILSFDTSRVVIS